MALFLRWDEPIAPSSSVKLLRAESKLSRTFSENSTRDTRYHPLSTRPKNPTLLLSPPRSRSFDDDEALAHGVGSLALDEDTGGVRFLATSAASTYLAMVCKITLLSEFSNAEVTRGQDGASSGFPEVGVAQSEECTSRRPSFPYASSTHSTFSTHGPPDAQEIEALRAMLPRREEGERLAEGYYANCSFMFEPIEVWSSFTGRHSSMLLTLGGCFQKAQFWDEYLPNAYSANDSHGSQLACVFGVIALGLLFDRYSASTYNSQASQFFRLSQATLSASRFLSSGDYICCCSPPATADPPYPASDDGVSASPSPLRQLPP